MESLILTGKTISVIRTIGLDVAIHTLQKTTSIIGSSISFIRDIECSSIDSIKNRLHTLDIEKTINIIHHFITELNMTKDVKESTKLSILSINEILQKIQDELNDVKNDIEYHMLKYFYSWRSINCDDKLNNISNHSIILEKRFEMLIKLLSVYTL